MSIAAKAPPYALYSGSGNTFAILEGDHFLKEELKAYAVHVCRQHRLDGLLAISSTQEADFKLQIFNSDGSQASMCGNGLRCAAFHYYSTSRNKNPLTIETDRSILSAEIKNNSVRTSLMIHKQPVLFPLPTNNKLYRGYLCDTGVPHYVVLVDSIDDLSFNTDAPALRFHELLAPEGANINFVQRYSRKEIFVRTYERGVEGETLACATGCAAAFLTLVGQQLTDEKASVKVKSGETLLYELAFPSTLYVTGRVEKLDTNV